MNDNNTSTDKELINQPVTPPVDTDNSSQQPLTPTTEPQVTDNTDDSSQPDFAKENETLKKNYSDSTREALRLKGEADNYRKQMEEITYIFSENPSAYDTFKEAYNSKVTDPDLKLKSYEDQFSKARPSKDKDSNIKDAVIQNEETSNSTGLSKEEFRQELKRVQAEEKWQEEQASARQQYWDAYPDMDPKKYAEGTPEYTEKANLELKVLEVANTLIKVGKFTNPGDALVNAHKLVTGEDATEREQAEDDAHTQGLIEGLRKGNTSSPAVKGGTGSGSSGSFTKEDIALAKMHNVKPEKIQELRRKGMID
jgi:hypothetical protein